MNYVITQNGLSGTTKYEKVKFNTAFILRNLYLELCDRDELALGNANVRVDNYINDMEVIQALDAGVSSTNVTDLFLGSLGVTIDYPSTDRKV